MHFPVEKAKQASEAQTPRLFKKVGSRLRVEGGLKKRKQPDFDATLECEETEDAEARLLEAFEFLLEIQESPDFPCEPRQGLERFGAEADEV